MIIIIIIIIIIHVGASYNIYYGLLRWILYYVRLGTLSTTRIIYKLLQFYVLHETKYVFSLIELEGTICVA